MAKKKFQIISIFSVLFFLVPFIACEQDDELPEIKEPELQAIVSDLQFAEGPAFYNGSLYFSDIQANKIYKWNENTGSQVFISNSGAANGIYFDNNGDMIVCQGGNKQLVTIDAEKNITVITDKFEDTSYNEPNDVWQAPNGNIYFTDPIYTGTLSQAGEYVYCVKSSTGEVIRVIDDLVKPNGIIGNVAGSKLYVADHGASKIYQYPISSDGTLGSKQLFASVQADGLSIDSSGNVYAASESILIFNSSGQQINSIDIPGTITNICITESESKLAYITTHNRVYKQVFDEQ